MGACHACPDDKFMAAKGIHDKIVTPAPDGGGPRLGKNVTTCTFFCARCRNHAFPPR
jgi:hypothetical protein